ncbi:hypothetical protein WDZ17_07235 [Pseudokineococcus basanitobsidens]|uniref:BON domain-containing protein n=1 Tax=Pseudokineococcus basanitobsidens TaxID=1926649 RepID=A0ABU8RJ80_9ACTN
MTAAPEDAGRASREAASAAKSRLAGVLAGDGRVNGVGVVRWRSAYAVRVSVVTEEDRPDLPAEVDGVPVRVEAVGEITAGPVRDGPS